MIKSHNKLKIGITHGDINSISYEIIIKTFLDKRIYELCTPILYGSPKVLAYHRTALNITKLNHHNIKKPIDARYNCLNVINCVEDSIKVELGQSVESAGIAAYNALERATNDLKNGLIDVIVTNPINKSNIQSENFSFPGHTEYLTAKFNQKDSLMILINEKIKVGVVTTHVPLADVNKYITKENILRKIKILNDSLIKDFTKAKPKIAVLGLNPHISNNGLIGKEEKEIIIPSINQAREDKILAFGPYSADGFWGTFEYKKFDAVLAMYHDQGLIPFKILAFEDGINFTAGLPIVRTSPSHGTAYELAGLNRASNQSFRQAIYYAIEIFKNRNIYKEISANPLEQS